MTPKKAAKPAQMSSFEEDMAKLEALALQMEQSDMPLDALMSAYEEGTLLAKGLQERLERSKARLSEVKMQKDGSVVTTPSDIAVQGNLLDDME